ncbi:MAG: PhoU domain-containing protein [Thermodesulfobacteriota bacterium]
MEKEAVLSGVDIDKEISRMFDLAKEMFLVTWDGFKKLDEERLREAEKIGKELHEKEKMLTLSIMAGYSTGENVRDEIAIGHIPSHLERIGDNIELLSRCSSTIIKEGVCFSDRAIKEINTLFDNAIVILQSAGDILKSNDKEKLVNIRAEGRKFQEIISGYSLSHYDRLIEGVCMPKSSSSYLAILDYLSGIEKHIRNIVERMED